MIIFKENGFFENFQGHDRFNVPEPLYRVTGGFGGESYLIMGSEKTALYDCGMACFSKVLLENIHRILDPLGRKVDYILLSHSHYDHIGALPYVLDHWPDAVVCGAEKIVRVFNSEAARATMKELGENADRLYSQNFGPVRVDGLRIDRVLREEDEVELGDTRVVFYEAKGHTDCSAAYMVLPQKILFLSESMGQLETPEKIGISCIKSFDQSIASARKMAALKANHIISMHYGMIPEYFNEEYFDFFIREAEWERTLIQKCIKAGLSDDETCKVHDIFYWKDEMELYHPYEAEHLNTMIIIRRVRKEMEEENGKL